ncbi:DNRLRE domain-containing protein [candidate division KSB1 bacterium]
MTDYRNGCRYRGFAISHTLRHGLLSTLFLMNALIFGLLGVDFYRGKSVPKGLAYEIPISQTGTSGQDTLRVNSDLTHIVLDAGGKLILQAGQNYYDKDEQKFKKRDLSIKDISLAKEKNKKDGFKHIIENDVVVLLNDSLQRVRVESPDGDYVMYEPIGVVKQKANVTKIKAIKNQWKDTDVEIIPTAFGIKENIILKNSGAPTTFKYKIYSNLPYFLEENSVVFHSTAYFVSPLWAYDAENKEIPLIVSLSNDTLTITADVSGAVFPVIIDPSIDYQPDATGGKDAHIDQGLPGDNFGTSQELDVQDWTDSKERFVIEFDTLNSSVFTGATITSATLTIHYNNIIGDNTGTRNLSLYHVTEEWAEGTVTWNSINGDYDSENPFATYDATGISGTGYVPFNVKTLIQDVIDNNKQYGWMVKFDDESHGSANDLTIRFESSDAATPANRPQLEVSYEIVRYLTNFTLSDSSITSAVFTVDTTLNTLSAFDSFNVVLAVDNTVLGSFTDTTGTITDLESDSLYIMEVFGYADGSIAATSNIDSIGTLPAVATIDLPSAIDSTYKLFTAKWDTVLNGYADWDSFAVFLASDSTTRLSAFTTDTTVTTSPDVYYLGPSTQYTFVIVGYVDAERTYSVSETVSTLPYPTVTLDFSDSTYKDADGYYTITAWNGATIDSFEIVLASDSSSMSEVISDSTVTTVDTLTNDTQYTFKARVVIDDTTSLYSANETVSTLPLKTVSNLAFSDSLYRSVTAFWDTTLWGQAPFDSFAIFLASDSTTRMSDFTADTTIMSYDTLTSLTAYEFIVVGYYDGSAFAYSSSATVTTDSLPAPYEMVVENLSLDEVIISIIDTSGSPNLRLVFYDSLGILSNDTLSFNGVNPDTLYDTLSIAGFPDSLVAIKSFLLNVNDDSTLVDTTLQFRLLALYVPAVMVSDTTDTTMQIVFPDFQTVDTDSNPSRVWYQLFDSSLGLVVDPDGDTTAVDTLFWPKADYDTIDYNLPLGVNTVHKLFVNSRNSDSVKTGFLYYDSLWTWAQYPDVDSVFAQDSVTVFILMESTDNPSYTYYALEDSIRGLFYDLDNLRFRSAGVTVDSSWAWYTYAQWGGASGTTITVAEGQLYVLRFYSKDGNIK